MWGRSMFGDGGNASMETGDWQLTIRGVGGGVRGVAARTT